MPAHACDADDVDATVGNFPLLYMRWGMICIYALLISSISNILDGIPVVAVGAGGIGRRSQYVPFSRK